MMIEDNKIEQMATVISNFCDKHQYDLTEQEIDDIALDMADKGYGNVREYEKRLCDKYIEIDNLNRDYSNAFERLKSQQQEIERLKAENETYCKQINQAYDTGYDDGYESCQDDIKKADGRENYDLKAENKQLKTECALLDDELRIARQETIDVLNKVKEKLNNTPNCWAYTTYIDELIKGV